MFQLYDCSDLVKLYRNLFATNNMIYDTEIFVFQKTDKFRLSFRKLSQISSSNSIYISEVCRIV